MVTTRSARKGTSSPSSARSTPAPSNNSSASSPTTTITTNRSRRNNNNNSNKNQSSSSSSSWTHAPTRATLVWFAFSLPLVAWDSVYVLLRPLTMEGGSLHWPLWAPYKLYGEVDHVYGWKAFRARSGFTAAQGSLNVVETALYLAYLWIYFASARGVVVAAAAASSGSSGNGNGNGNAAGVQVKKVLTGRPAAVAVLLAFSSAVMTLSKTVLYWLNEYFSGFDNIGHNSWQDLVPLWIIPNGAWLIFPTYMIYVMGGEIIDGLTAASTGVSVKSE